METVGVECVCPAECGRFLVPLPHYLSKIQIDTVDTFSVLVHTCVFTFFCSVYVTYCNPLCNAAEKNHACMYVTSYIHTSRPRSPPLYTLTSLLCQSESQTHWRLNWCKHSMFKGSVLIFKNKRVVDSVHNPNSHSQTLTHSHTEQSACFCPQCIRENWAVKIECHECFCHTDHSLSELSQSFFQISICFFFSS